MPVVEAHFFAPNDLNGDTIFECSSDDQFLKGIRLDIQRDKLGNGLIEFARRVPLGIFVNEIVQPEVFVRFLVPEISATDYLWGCFLDYRQQKVVSVKEKGGEGFRFRGPGPKFYLTRTVLWSASFSGYDNAVHRDEHVWTWPESARAGAILNRLILEDQSNPSGPYLPDLTKSFSDANDSDGVPWAEDVAAGADEFSLNIGDDYLKLLWTLENAGSLVTQMTLGSVGSPLMQLDAYQTFGRDLTGAIGASTVHFTEGVNILTDLDVEGASLRKASHALVRGAEGVYELAVRPSWDSSQYRKVAFHVYENTDNNTWLDKAGVRFLQRQENGERQIKLRWQPGFDPEAGLYMPGPDGTNGHLWVGDTVDLTTGAGSPTELDYSSDPQLVTGIEMELLKAARDDSAEEAARSWKLTALLNYDRESNATVPAGGTAGGGTDSRTNTSAHRLCRAIAAGTPPDIISVVGALGDMGTSNNMLADVPSDEEGAAWYAVVVDTGGGTIGAQWQHDALVPGTREDMTLLDSETVGGLRMSWFRLLDPTPTTGATAHVRITDSAGQERLTVAWYVTGVDEGDPEGAPVFANGSGVASALSIPAASHQLALNAAAWFANNQTGMGNPTPGGGQTSDFADSDDRPFGQPDSEAGAGHGSSAPTWTFSSSQAWLAGGVAVSGVLGISGDGHPDLIGTSTRVARCDHRHDVHRDTAPTVDDDSDLGYKPGTIWAQLDDLDTPTEIVAVWMLVDADAGTWLPWPGQQETGQTLADTEAERTFVISAHRGDIGSSDSYPENTIEGFIQAAIKGAHRVELDAQWNADETFYCIHDTTVDRTTDGTGNVADKTDAQMDALNIDGGEGYDAGRHGTSLSVPTLTAVFDAVRPYDIGIDLDLKTSSTAAHTALAELIVARGIEHLVNIRAESLAGAAAIKAVSSRILVGAFTAVTSSPQTEDDVDIWWAQRSEVDALADVTSRAPDYVQVHVTTGDGVGVDEEAWIRDQFSYGVRSYMTNNLEQALSIRMQLLGAGSASAVWHPLMAQDPSDSKWYVVVDGDGTAIMVEAP